MADQAQFRSVPLLAIAALGVTDDRSGTRRELVVHGAPVVEAEQTAVLEHGVVAAGVAFPGHIVHDRHVARHRLLQAQLDAAHPVDQVLIDEELAPVAQLYDVRRDAAGSLPSFPGWLRTLPLSHFRLPSYILVGRHRS